MGTIRRRAQIMRKPIKKRGYRAMSAEIYSRMAEMAMYGVKNLGAQVDADTR